MFAIKMTVDNFAAYCYSHYIVVSIVMSFEIMTKKCVLKGFKTGEKSRSKNTEMNNRLFHLDIA